MKKIVILGLSTILASSFILTTSCKKKKKLDTENFVEVQAYNRGYGIEGLEAVAKAYMKKNPDITISISGVTDCTLGNDIYQGPSTITTDMYFYGGPNFFNLINSKNVTLEGKVYPTYFESLNDVVNSSTNGESALIKDKIQSDYLDYNNANDGVHYTDDSYFCLPWIGGLSGLVYNSKMFETYHWNIPVTTDELIETCKAICDTDAKSTNKNSKGKSIKIAPFGYTNDANYFENVFYHWWAQYDGAEAFENFYKGLDINGEYNEYLGASKGREYMVYTIDALLGCFTDGQKRNYIFSDPTLATKSFIDGQSTFLSAEGARVNDLGATTYAMMPNGDWLENEMYANYSTKLESGEIAFKMMKVPVTSDIIKHSDCTSIADDAELAALIRAIDNGSTALTGDGYDVDQKAFNKVKNARGITIRTNNYNVYIPVFAKAKEAAKDFLKYYYSDEAIAIYAKTTRGEDVPTNFDYSSLSEISDFSQSKFSIFNSTSRNVFISDKNPVVYRGNLMPFPAYNPMVTRFNVSSSKDYVSPKTIYEGNVNELKRLYQQMLKDAGIL